MDYNFYPRSSAAFACYTAPAGPSVAGTTVTAHASAHTKGLYSEVVASLPFTCNYVHITIRQTNTNSSQGLLDLATGGAGSETDVIPNMLFEGISQNAMRGTANVILVPLAITAGTRVSCRQQCNNPGDVLQVVITFIKAGDIVAPTSYTAHGVNTGNSLGTEIDPGGSINTYGDWVELASSLSADANVIFPMFTSRANTGPASSGWAVTIGTGAAMSETDLIPDMRLINGSNAAILVPHGGYTFPTYIAAGTRVAMRASCSTNDATDRLIRTALYTATGPAEPSGGGGGGNEVAYGFVG